MGMNNIRNSEAGGEWQRAAASSDPDDCRIAPELLSHAEMRTARLIKTIEAEIVPRLVLTRRIPVGETPARAQAAALPEVFDVQELVRLLLAHDVTVAAAYVETVLERGTSLDGICLNLLAPAARELGLLWEEDECDFMQVTVGLCRLHQILRNLAPHFPVESITNDADRRILLVAVPGEQHTFGITLVAQFLMRAGWDVWQEFPASDTDIVEVVRHNWFTVIGLSIGSDSRLDNVTGLIKTIRAASRNRNVGILAGGPVMIGRPELAALLGADAAAVDGRETIQFVESVSRSEEKRR